MRSAKLVSPRSVTGVCGESRHYESNAMTIYRAETEAFGTS